MAKRTTRTTTRATQQTASADDQGIGVAPAPDTRNDSMASEPSEEEIRSRAYRRYLERGGADGQDFDDWLEAERELKEGS